jgi:N-acetyl-anhydromuramyl-L-alanine amidase AmpD
MTGLQAERSVHYYIDTQGTILQLVDEQEAALHSGIARWNGQQQDLDPISVGIALEHRPGQSYARQMPPLRALLRALAARHAIALRAQPSYDDLPPPLRWLRRLIDRLRPPPAPSVVPWSSLAGSAALAAPETDVADLRIEDVIREE